MFHVISITQIWSEPLNWDTSVHVNVVIVLLT